MSAIVEGIAAYKVTDRNKVVEKAYFQMEYDGDEFNLAGVKNDQIVIMSMTNDEIMELLARRADPRSIEERLQADYGRPIVVKSPSKKSRRRQSKAKSARRTRSRRTSPEKNSMPTITKTPAFKRE